MDDITFEFCISSVGKSSEEIKKTEQVKERYTISALLTSGKCFDKSEFETILTEIENTQIEIRSYIEWQQTLMKEANNGQNKVHPLNKLDPSSILRQHINEMWQYALGIPQKFSPIYVGLIRKLPGISNLNPNVLNDLLRESFGDSFLVGEAALHALDKTIIVLHASLYRNDEMYLSVENGPRLSYCWAVALFGQDIVDISYNFAQVINRLELNLTETILLCVVIITTSGTSKFNLCDITSIEHLNTTYGDLLYRSLSRRKQKPVRIIKEIYSSLLPQLPEMRQDRDDLLFSLRPKLMSS